MKLKEKLDKITDRIFEHQSSNAPGGSPKKASLGVTKGTIDSDKRKTKKKAC